MIIGTCVVYLANKGVYSLKGKRKILKSILQKSKNKFNISISEIENHDIHESIVIGFACVSNSKKHADSMIQNVLNYIDIITEAELVDIIIEIL